jgi:hypothetical protein
LSALDHPGIDRRLNVPDMPCYLRCSLHFVDTSIGSSAKERSTARYLIEASYTAEGLKTYGKTRPAAANKL